MPRYRFSDAASRSFREIAHYSRKTFGDLRGRAYMAAILAVCDGIAGGGVVTRSCRAAFADDLRDDLRFARSGSHFVIFVVAANGVTIIDFLHQSADIGNRIGGPPE